MTQRQNGSKPRHIGGAAMRLNHESTRSDFDELVSRFFGSDFPRMNGPSGGYNVPTDVFHTDDSLIIRMELPGVSSDDVEVTVQENWLLMKGTSKFPYEAGGGR